MKFVQFFLAVYSDVNSHQSSVSLTNLTSVSRTGDSWDNLFNVFIHVNLWCPKYIFRAICKFMWFRIYTAQNRNCVFADQFRNLHCHFCTFFKLRRNTPPACVFGWKANHIFGKNNWWAETRFHPELESWVTVSILSGHTIFFSLSFEIILLVLIRITFFAKCFKALLLKINACTFCTWFLLCLYRNFEIAMRNFEILLDNFEIRFPFRIG